MRSILIGGIAGTALAVLGQDIAAQESDNRVAAYKAWSVFEEPASCTVTVQDIGECPQDKLVPQQCWVVSGPTEIVNKKGDRIVAVERGVIRLFVSYSPGLNVKGQVSYKSGYPYGENSVVKLEISDSGYDLIAPGLDKRETSDRDESQFAWSKSDSDDAKIVASMKRGADAVITGVSRRNTTTIDTFSLFGFTAAVEDAEKRCGA
ncbi:MAG: hypothetical protein QNJ44_09725 [Rhodobacter sp.]|nr:hypothetical protein [Rhodobacter sp.]